MKKKKVAFEISVDGVKVSLVRRKSKVFTLKIIYSFWVFSKFYLRFLTHSF